MTEQPFIPVNGRILVRQLPYKPSKTIEVISGDKADETEGIVVAVSAFRYGRRRIKGGWEHTGDTFPHEVKVGDRVIFISKYADDDTLTLNGEKHRCLDSWEIVGVMTAPQPDYFLDPITSEKKTDEHPLIKV